jgi:hypothetical protein
VYTPKCLSFWPCRCPSLWRIAEKEAPSVPEVPAASSLRSIPARYGQPVVLLPALPNYKDKALHFDAFLSDYTDFLTPATFSGRLSRGPYHNLEGQSELRWIMTKGFSTWLNCLVRIIWAAVRPICSKSVVMTVISINSFKMVSLKEMMPISRPS